MPSEYTPPQTPQYKPLKKCLRMFISPGIIFIILRYFESFVFAFVFFLSELFVDIFLPTFVLKSLTFVSLPCEECYISRARYMLHFPLGKLPPLLAINSRGERRVSLFPIICSRCSALARLVFFISQFVHDTTFSMTAFYVHSIFICIRKRSM